jgi:amino acid adenylation domain-containing protein
MGCCKPTRSTATLIHTYSSSFFHVLLIVQHLDSVPCVRDAVEVQETFGCLNEYPVVVTITPDPKQVGMSWTFDETLVSEDRVRVFALQFEHALSQLCSVADSTRICELELASQSDKTHFFDWNAVHHKPIMISVVELLDTQIKQTPRAVAIDAWDGTLSYESLDRTSSIFAAELVHMGVRPNTLVGHCFEKSSWAVVALIAIIKAGGAFAPFSPGYPRERLLTFTQDTGVQLILCSSQQWASLTDGPWKILVVDDLAAERLSPDLGVLPQSVSPDSLIYALQTSGTTGQPKAFPVRHAAFATGVVTRKSLIQRGRGSRVLQFGPYTFRLGIENILATLAAGGCICIPSDKDVMDDLSGYIGRAKITFANVTPSMARMLEARKMPNLQVLLLSDEPPDRDLIRTWNGHVQLVNGYGPSEFTAKQTLNFSMTEDDPHNLGRAVGASLWVVDQENHERLSPLGAIGELLIEGPTLADGYINRTLEMEKRFIATPAWLAEFRKEKTTVFKTGDLVKYNLDGSLTSVGRADGQVKLHGQRFEAKEVEHHIKTHLADESLDVLVDIIRFKGQDSDVVAAFLTPKKHKLQNAIEVDVALSNRFASEKRGLVEYLSRLLPSYMIPSVFLSVTVSPVTANGKADRRALKAFGSQLSSSDTNTNDKVKVARPPQSDEEIKLHRLWKELMRLEEDQFGPDDHFLELGGTSMTAIRLVALAREARLSLTAQSIFMYPVLKDMALQLKQIHGSPKLTSVPITHLLEGAGCNLKQIKDQLTLYGLSENEIEDMYPCLDLQSFYMKKAVVSPGSTTYQHLYKLPNGIDIPRLESALERVCEATPSIRTRIILVSGKLIQLVCKEKFVCRQFTQLDLCFEQDRDLSWELGAPLSRFSIVHDVQNSHQPDYLVWSSNHAIWDQWSRRLIWQDIDYAYQHNCLPPARPSYRNFIAHVCRQNSSECALDSSILRQEYIGRQFASLSPVGWSQLDARSSRKMAMTIDLRTPDHSNISHSCLLLTCWTLAVAIVENSNNVLTVNQVNGRSSDFPGVEELAGPAIGAVPLSVGLQAGTVLDHAVLVHSHTIEGLAMQHTVGLDKQLLSQMESSAYWVLVNDQGAYEDPATESLQLRRSRVEKIAVGVWPFHLTFNVHPRNTKVETEAIFAFEVASAEKVAKLFASLKLLLNCVFAPGGLQLNTDDLRLSVNEMLDGGSGILEEVMATVPVESRHQESQCNPYPREG